MNNKTEIISLAEIYVKVELGSDTSGHDWWHIDRVRNLAIAIAQTEEADCFVCELAALLHDVADEKLNTSKAAGLHKVQSWLSTHNIEEAIANHVMLIISSMSYNGGKNPPMETIEGKIVQDADRLDALGAIGIARTFLYSGWKGQPMHNPEGEYTHLEYRSNNKTAVFHFYEKLLKLKELMNTEYAKELASSRHDFMENYLEQFYREWNFDVRRKPEDEKR